jgi:hypothetical protein
LLDPEYVHATTSEWLRAWNEHDLDAVMHLYADPLEFVSPLVVERLGRPDGTITRKDELRDYFARSLGAGSTLRFDLKDILIGVHSWTTLFTNHRGQLVGEVAFPDDNGLIERVYVHQLNAWENDAEQR